MSETSTERVAEKKPTSRKVSTALHMARSIEEASAGKGQFGLGAVADLRRMDVERPPSVFWAMFGASLEGVPDNRIRAWALVAKCQAIMGRNCQLDGTSPGAALRAAGFSVSSNMRLDRLCSAEGKAFEEILIAACRQLAQKAQPLDWRSFVFFAIAEDSRARAPAILRLQRDFHSQARPGAASAGDRASA